MSVDVGWLHFERSRELEPAACLGIDDDALATRSGNRADIAQYDVDWSERRRKRLLGGTILDLRTSAAQRERVDQHANELAGGRVLRFRLRRGDELTQVQHTVGCTFDPDVGFRDARLVERPHEPKEARQLKVRVRLVECEHLLTRPISDREALETRTQNERIHVYVIERGIESELLVNGVDDRAPRDPWHEKETDQRIQHEQHPCPETLASPVEPANPQIGRRYTHSPFLIYVSLRWSI